MNGETINPVLMDVAFRAFAGRAGVRLAGSAWQFAAIVRKPSAPQDGVVDGRKARIVSAVPSATATGMFVLTFVYLEAA